MFGWGNRNNGAGLALPRPVAFTAAQWAVADAGNGRQAVVTILEHPASRFPVRKLQYRAGGAGLPWEDLLREAADVWRTPPRHPITGGPVAFWLRAVSRAGVGDPSDEKAVTIAALTAPAFGGGFSQAFLRA
ncbi:MAG: hypothetical protein ACK4WC_08995 [Rubrimonas sp.]